MPSQPHLSMVRDAALGVDVPQFQLIGFRSDAGSGGLLNFDCQVGITQAQIDGLVQSISNAENLHTPALLAPVPLVDGTVKLLAMGQQSGNTAVTDTSAPEFVLRIDQGAKPALFGNNQATFSVLLDKDGYTLMSQCLEGEILPVAVIYSLDYLGLRPAYAIRLKVDWDRVQKHMDESFSTGFLFVSADIGKAVDELVDKRAIILESDTFVPEGDDSKGIIDRRDAALAQVRNMIADAFFSVSLPPWTPEKKADWEKAIDAVGKVMASQAAMAAGGPAAAAASGIGFSYKRMDYTRMDKKQLNVNFSERTTVRKSMYPQGHLASLLKPLRDGNLPRSRFVQEVSLDNPWFINRRVDLSARADFAADDVSSINVRAQYGQKTQNAILTPTQPAASLSWLSDVQGGVPRREVDISFEVGFKPIMGLDRPLSLKSEVKKVDVEKVEITPRELYAITPIPVIAENFPWDRYTSVEVHLRYSDPAHEIKQENMIRLTKDQTDAVWKLFQLDHALDTYEIRLVYRALDNHDIDQGWSPSSEPQITVRNPFPTQRVLEIVPALAWSEVQAAFVDLRYEDPAHQVLVEDSIDFAEGSAVQRFKVDLRNTELKTVYYTVSISFKDGRFITVPESMTNDRRIVLRADMKGRRVISVRPPQNFEQRRLRKVTVEVRFEDLLAGLSFANAYVFESSQGLGQFEYDIVDTQRRTYEFKTTVQFENGLIQESDWVASESPSLQLKPV
jgi:hypothetical protein